MNRETQITPPSVVEGGIIHTGYFRTPFQKLNFHDAAGRNGVRHWRLKEWLGFGITHPDWHLGPFLTNAKYTGAAGFFALDRRDGRMVKYSRPAFPNSVRLADGMFDGISSFRSRGFCIEMRHNLDTGEHTIFVDISGSRSLPSVQAEMRLFQDLSRLDPLVVSLPLGRGHNLCTHKAIMPADGTVIVGSDEIHLDPARDVAVMDEHKSHLPYSTAWRWVTFGGFDGDGRLVGVNLGDHDTIANPREWTENCLWIDGRISLCGPVEFEWHSHSSRNPWRIREIDGRAELSFFPDTCRIDNVSLGIVRMNYFQFCGDFRGHIIDPDGTRIPVNDMYGVAESMDAHW